MIPERMSELDTKLYQNLSAICPQYRGKNISDEEINNIAMGLVIVKGTPVIKQIRVTQANAKPDPLIVKLLRCLCSEQMGAEPKVNLQAPPAPPMPPHAPSPPAPFAPPAPEPMRGVKHREPELKSQIEEQIEHLKLDKLFEDQVVESDLAHYESEEFFVGQSDEDLAGYLEEVRDTCEGMLEVGLMPADFANQMMDRLGGLASAIGDEVHGVEAITEKTEVIITRYQQAIERMNSEIADLAVDELLGMPSDEQVKSEIARISKQDTSIDEKREFLKKLDKSSWKEAHLTRCKRLTSIESPMGSIKFNNEFSSLIKDLGRTLVNGIKEQSIVMEDQSLQITEPLKNEVRERVEVERITSILDIGKRAVLRSNLFVNEKQLSRAVNSFAKAFVIDCHSARPKFISTFDLNREQIEKFFVEEGIVENVDKIVAILVDELRQQYSDGVSKRVADEKSNPNSEQNKLAVNSFRGVLEQLSLLAENVPTQDVKDFIDHLEQEFEKSVRNQSNMGDNAKEVLRQVERAGKYTLIESRPFAAGAFGSVYKLAVRNGNEPTHVLKILGTSIPKKEWARYHQEGELVAKRIEHENVLSLNDVLLDDKGAIIGLIGPYMSGGDLSYIEKLTSPISEDQAMFYLSHMAKGIQALHDNGVAHLDLNLGNFLMEGNLLRVMDFGTSRVVGVRGEVRVDPGKRQYSAPEEERGIATTKSDCFSFGMLMYRMLEGRPFDRKNIVFKNIKDENIKALITGFLQPEPNNRPSVGEFLRYLEER